MPSSSTRLLRVLDMFTVERPVWTGDALCEALGYPRTTGYRYIKELVQAGLLQRSGSLYVVGSRVVALDHVVRQQDPLLRLAVPVMKAMVTQAGCDCHLAIFDGQRILETHLEMRNADPRQFLYRGRLRPLFRGAAAKVILANLKPARLKTLYAAHMAEAAEAGLGKDWPDFRSAMRKIRKTGYHFSHGEVTVHLTAIAAPVFGSEASLLGALQLAGTQTHFAELDTTELTALVVGSAAKISEMLASGVGWKELSSFPES